MNGFSGVLAGRFSHRIGVRGEIVDFEPRHEHGYRLRVERFATFPDGVTGSPDVPAYGYRWLETLEAVRDP